MSVKAWDVEGIKHVTFHIAIIIADGVKMWDMTL